MDPHDNSSGLDPRLARWSAGRTSRSPRPRTPLATPRSLIAASGGEVPFWLAWLRGEAAPEMQAWFRRQAELDPDLRDDLGSIEQPLGSGCSTRAARTELRDALEALTYLTEGPPAVSRSGPWTAPLADDELSETDLAGSGRDSREARRPTHEEDTAGPLAELRRRIRFGLFALLAEVEIIVPPGDEVVEGTRLFQHLVGLAAVNRFLHLQQLQARPWSRNPPLRDRLLHALAPELFARDGERFRHHLSFRLFLRTRLQHYCQRRGWLPSGPRFSDLPTAFAALGRERIGTIVRGVLEAREALEGVGVPCGQVVALLDTAA